MRYTLLFALCSVALSLVQAQVSSNCYDIVHLKDGSSFQGTIIQYAPGDSLTLKTWSGLTIGFNAGGISKITQKCNNPSGDAPYSFKEKGFYQAARLGFMPGTDEYGDFDLGSTFQLSAGYSWNRLLATGVGAGAEYISHFYDDVANYPVFAECRGYFRPRRVSGFYNLGAGWAFVRKGDVTAQDFGYEWKGGLMAQAQLGYRFGNHFLCYLGFRTQRRVRNYNLGTIHVEEKLKHRRMELGIGITI